MKLKIKKNAFILFLIPTIAITAYSASDKYATFDFVLTNKSDDTWKSQTQTTYKGTVDTCVVASAVGEWIPWGSPINLAPNTSGDFIMQGLYRWGNTPLGSLYRCTLVNQNTGKSFTLNFSIYPDVLIEMLTISAPTGDAAGSYFANPVQDTTYYLTSTYPAPANEMAHSCGAISGNRPDSKTFTFTWDNIDMTYAAGQRFANSLNKKLRETFSVTAADSSITNYTATYDKENEKIILTDTVPCTDDICSTVIENPYQNGFTDICNTST